MELLTELMVLPVAARNKRADFAAETGWMRHRLDEFEESRANAGVTLERVSLLETPYGDITISYLEGTHRYRDVARTIRTTPTLFDQDMMNRGRVLHGLSEEQQREKRVGIEPAVAYRVEVSPRQRWHAFAAALPPGGADRWHAFCAALNGERREAFEAFNRANGFVVFQAGLYHGAAGDLGCYYLEGSEDQQSLPRALSADGEFERWFTAEFDAAHGSDIRDGLPSPAVGVPWDWVQGEANESVSPLFDSLPALLGD